MEEFHYLCGVTDHETYMQRCLDLARKGAGYTAPNPMVGCVIIDKQQNIIGEGYHEQYGAPHAEVNAIGSVHEKSLLHEATLYVNIEPCVHHGKTPPCVNLILETAIPRVITGMKDPYIKVAGKGIETLRRAGVEVITEIKENACRDINKRFITFHEKHRPYIILKWAQSADQFIGRHGEKIKISNSETDILVHQWRSTEQAVLIGRTTAINDDPELTVRHVAGKNPARLVLSSSTSLPDHLKLQNNDAETHVIRITTGCGFESLIRFCREHEIISILVEGGAYTLSRFINAGMWDEARVIINPNLYLISGIKAPEFENSVLIKTEISGADVIRTYHRTTR